MAEDKFKESLRKILRDLASEETCCDCCRPASTSANYPGYSSPHRTGPAPVLDTYPDTGPQFLSEPCFL